MHQIVTLSREALIGDSGVLARAASRRGASACASSLAVCSLAVFWALTLAEVSSAESLSGRLLGPRVDSPAQTATAVRVAPDRAARVARSESNATGHSEKRLRAFLKISRSNDPYDDAASDDPNDDDDATDNLSGCCETDDGPISAWLQEVVRCPAGLEAESAVLSIEIPSSPFLLVYRLRC
jgi:hypothetical protein